MDQTKTDDGDATGRSPNRYDETDMIRREGVLTTDGLKIACYRVRDPDTGEFGSRQFHMTYDNTVMAFMSEEAAKLFARFVSQQCQGDRTDDATTEDRV